MSYQAKLFTIIVWRNIFNFILEYVFPERINRGIWWKCLLKGHLHANGFVSSALYFIVMPHRISLGHHWQSEAQESLKRNGVVKCLVCVYQEKRFSEKWGDTVAFICETTKVDVNKIWPLYISLVEFEARYGINRLNAILPNFFFLHTNVCRV